ncbi:hypothetical protein FO488_02055 [Geobacter sp. FeAm09]|uniref:hypothetical protein n=1 Tax=Geobacter sp. FeAm09 TaxID=2597769 RepID=UPI0011EFB25E|nr:hypothetical protein [Geobacter sp. FeAm09]QEM67060.1 hypothetical protein FO488_02055 [Geobacter sp. FeAm09]
MEPLFVSENFRWYEASNEFVDIRDKSRYPDTEFEVKVKVYEDRVTNWFLGLAKPMVKYQSPHDYVALSIALSYIEGVEQFREGKSTPRVKSGAWFTKSAKRIFPTAAEDAIKRLWEEARCGLFHCGFTDGKTYVSHNHSEALEIVGDHLNINPQKFVEATILDFEKYIIHLFKSKNGDDIRHNFITHWDDRWENS